MYKVVLMFENGNKLVLTTDLSKEAIDELLEKFSKLPTTSKFTLFRLPTVGGDTILFNCQKIIAIQVTEVAKNDHNN